MFKKMNRRRTNNQKTFVSDGVYNSNTETNNINIQREVKQELPTENVPTLEPPPVNPLKESFDNLDDSDVVDSNGKLKFKKIFNNRKKASVRIKEKRMRQNRRLRKTLIPKNALMALNEVKGVVVGEFTINNGPVGGFTSIVTVNNNQYEGYGSSKAAAKNNASEKALRDIIICKLRENPRSSKSVLCNEPMDTGDDNTSNNGVDELEDVPMINLASFAIYKLFSDWENEGYVIPEMHPGAGGNTTDNEGASPQKEPKKTSIRYELPPNWEAMHPASLLCVMRPGITYVDKGTSGEKPNVVHTLAVTVDDKEFEDSARNKKLARRNVAALTCNTLFDTNFELDTKES